MSNLPDAPTVSQTAPAVKPISIIRDTTRSGRLMRGAVACGTWYRYAGGPVGIKIDGNHIWSVRVDTVRALLLRYGYAVEAAS